MPNPLNTIASIGNINTPVPQTLFGESAPAYRSNDADLQNGDRWFNTSTQQESIYYQGQWILLSK